MIGTLAKVFAVLAALLGLWLYYFLSSLGFVVRGPSQLNPQYDYIIVGGGSGGCVLANRLSESGENSVLLLEAGGDGSDVPWLHIPAAAPTLQGSSLDWRLRTQASPHFARGTLNGSLHIPRGKGLGGSSLLHAHVYNLGSGESWDGMGVAGWGWEDMQPYFQAMESVGFQSEGGAKRGDGGPIPVILSAATQIGRSFLDAVRGQDVTILKDYNLGRQEGFARAQQSTKNGWRWSSAEAYLRDAARRPNLHIVTDALVTKINLDESGRAVGVDYLWGGAHRRVLVNYEIISSAGVYGTPKLLILSGIGPKEELERWGIPQHMPLRLVGENLINSFGLTLHYSVEDDSCINGLDVKEMFWALVEWLREGSGPFASSMGEVLGWHRSGQAETAGPDLQQYFLPTDALLGGRFGSLLPYSAATTAAAVAGMNSGGGFSIGTSLERPRSRGRIRLASADPREPVIVQANYLEDERDLEALLEGLKAMRGLAASEAMKRHGARSAESVQPGCEGLELWSDAYIRCLIRHRGFGLYHESGTAQMGSGPDNSVLDSALRVHGIRGLRVVDTSVFPSLPSGNTAAAVTALAEKASKLILAQKDEFRNPQL